MIDPDKRKAVLQLHLEGVPLREISRLLSISRNSVRRIIKQPGAGSDPPAPSERKDKIRIDVELLRRLYQQCDGWIQRVHEKLREEEQIQVSYSTLTRMLRQQGISKASKSRCQRVPDEPGAEMQHDTTVYQVKLANPPGATGRSTGQRVKVIASLLYLRYSKRRYLKFYRVFNRFAMKCFLHEALMFWGYAAKICVIDNTNLARLRGAGKRAVIVPEMEQFARRYGFEFLCHEIGHANRKAGEERSFWTVQTNFLPGRCFENMEDLNQQAFEWASKRLYHRPVSKTHLIPAKAFEFERSYLQQLSPHLPPPFLSHQRDVDQYGYVSFDGNSYWVPGESREEVKVLQYADRLTIFAHRRLLAEYPLAPQGVKNQHFRPSGQPAPGRRRNRKRDSQEEEKQLRGMGAEVSAYVDYVLETPGIQRHRLLRELLILSRRVTREVFLQTLQRALRYRVANLPTLHNIAWFCMSQAEGASRSPAEANIEAEVDESYRQRPAYQEGFLTEEPDLSDYDQPDHQPDHQPEGLDEPKAEREADDSPHSPSNPEQEREQDHG